MKHSSGEWGSLTTGEIVTDNDESIGWIKKKEDRERIVACVNACEGIGNEALEEGVVGEMLETLKTIIKRLDAVREVEGLTIETFDAYTIALKVIAKAEGTHDQHGG